MTLIDGGSWRLSLEWVGASASVLALVAAETFAAVEEDAVAVVEMAAGLAAGAIVAATFVAAVAALAAVIAATMTAVAAVVMRLHMSVCILCTVEMSAWTRVNLQVPTSAKLLRLLNFLVRG